MILLNIIPGTSLNAGRPAEDLPTVLSDRVSLNRIRARRRWAARSAMLLGLTGLLLILIVTWRRDTNTIRASMRHTERSCGVIQAHLDRTRLLPARLPEENAAGLAYATYFDRFYAERVSRPVMIAWSSTLALKLLPDGRSVILYESGKVRAVWMNMEEFSKAYLAQMHDMDQFEQDRRAGLLKRP